MKVKIKKGVLKVYYINKGWEDEEENNYKINNNKINNNRFTPMNNNSISQNHYEEYRSEQKDRKIMNNINMYLSNNKVS